MSEATTIDFSQYPPGFRERLIEREIQEVADRAWSILWEIDYGLKWDSQREAWVDSSGHAYDGGRLRDYARAGTSHA